MATDDQPEQRVEFDFDITFTNGGSLHGEAFRLDLDGDTRGAGALAEATLADTLVRDLNLLLVGHVSIHNPRVVAEPHKRAAARPRPLEHLDDHPNEHPNEHPQPRRYLDLSHTVEDGMITYKGLPAPIICDFLSREASHATYAEGTEFQIGRIELVANTGTYVDSPFHRFADGHDLSELALTSLADLDAVVVHVSGSTQRPIPHDAFAAYDLRGKAVLVHTGWDAHWRTDQYFEGHPFLTEDAAVVLRDAGARLVGIDSYNIDDTGDGRRPVHTTLLRAAIPIVEHLCGLDQLPASGLRFSAVPVKVKGMGTFPVRAYARVDR